MLLLNAFDISFDFSTAYNLAIMQFASKARGTRMLTSCRSHMWNFSNSLFGVELVDNEIFMQFLT